MSLDTVALRREIHAHPETASREIRPTARIAEVLTGLGLEPRTGAGGSSAHPTPGASGPRTARFVPRTWR